ncbi:MAG: hypothetical protein AAFY14_11745 [Pseudomonadota bacterium]
MIASGISPARLGQFIVDAMNRALSSQTGKRQLRRALVHQWPPDLGAADLVAIEETIETLKRERVLEFLVEAAPRIAFVRQGVTPMTGPHISQLTRTSDGRTTLLLSDALTQEQVIHETIDALVGEITAVAIMHDVHLDHQRLYQLAESVAMRQASLLDRTFLAPR